MNSYLGSQWRKWDFHVHTPYSILRNEFKRNGRTLNADNEEDFDWYVTQLFTEAIQKDIWAIGITDYFSIDGYKRIRNKYLGDPKKMEELFPDSGMRERIDQILVFPNIEFRLNRFVPDDNHEKNIGYHVIFSDEVSTEVIEDNFLHKLRCAPDHYQSWTLTHGNIERLGTEVRRHQGERGNSYLIGLRHVVIDESEVLAALKECQDFEGRHLIAVPVDEAVCKAGWEAGRNYLPKKILYEQSHCYMTSSPSTRAWALEPERVSEFGDIKPCIWGSDAHSFDVMFEPDKHRYCWVKADPTFEGFLQILCEPSDRIAIQEEKPEQRMPYRSIESITFHDQSFQREPVYFNEGLTCIIGGKSTGKSLLLRQLARSAGHDYALRQEKQSSVAPLELSAEADVSWRDGGSGERKVVYLPQTYLNRTVDDPEAVSGGASEIVSSILLQNDRIAEAHRKFLRDKRVIAEELQSNLVAYDDTDNRIDSIRKQLSALGISAIFEKSTKELEEEYASFAGPGLASSEELDTYDNLISSKQAITNITSTLDHDIQILGSLDVPRINKPTYNGLEACDALSDVIGKRMHEEIEGINRAVEQLWGDAVERLVSVCEKDKSANNSELARIEEQLLVLQPKIEKSSRLSGVMSRLNEERKKLIASLALEQEIGELAQQRGELEARILESRRKYSDVYHSYCSEIATLSVGIAEGLEFSADPVWRKGDFCAAMTAALDGRTVRSFAKASGIDLSLLDDDAYDDGLLKNVWKAVRGERESGNLQLKSGYSEAGLLERLFSDWYNVHYVVTSDGDRLDRMSPGKKGLVLLELILELEHGDCPILIDQPEDDLDNQSIYSELRRFIKTSKKRRQVIIVTHNANIAVGADAEEIIVANQHGEGRENAERKFEYRSGAIENCAVPSASDLTKVRYLDKYSIRDHICQILEGGREALDQRRRKYMVHA